MSITLAGGSPLCLLFLSSMSILFVFVFASCAVGVVVSEDRVVGGFLLFYAAMLFAGFNDGWKGMLIVLCVAFGILLMTLVSNGVSYIYALITGKGPADKDQDKTATSGKTHDWPSTSESE